MNTSADASREDTIFFRKKKGSESNSVNSTCNTFAINLVASYAYQPCATGGFDASAQVAKRHKRSQHWRGSRSNSSNTHAQSIPLAAQKWLGRRMDAALGVLQ